MTPGRIPGEAGCGGVAMAFRQASPTRGQVQGLGCVMTKAPPGQGPQPGAPLGPRLLWSRTWSYSSPQALSLVGRVVRRTEGPGGRLQGTRGPALKLWGSPPSQLSCFFWPEVGKPVGQPVGFIWPVEIAGEQGGEQKKYILWRGIMLCNSDLCVHKVEAQSLKGVLQGAFRLQRQTWVETNVAWCCCLVAQSCPTLCDPRDCSPPDSSVHGILQARILEWVAIPFSRIVWPAEPQIFIFSSFINWLIPTLDLESPKAVSMQMPPGDCGAGESGQTGPGRRGWCDSVPGLAGDGACQS